MKKWKIVVGLLSSCEKTNDAHKSVFACTYVYMLYLCAFVCVFCVLYVLHVCLCVFFKYIFESLTYVGVFVRAHVHV